MKNIKDLKKEQELTFEDLLQKMNQINLRAKNFSSVEKAYQNALLSNPQLRNNILQNLKTIPYLPDRETMEQALTNPRANEKLLRAIGGNLFTSSFPLYKLIRFYEGVLTYHSYVFPQNIKPEYMDKERFKREERFVNDWLDKLNPKYNFRRITQEVMQEGKRAYYLREAFAKGRDGEPEKEGVIPSYDLANRRAVSVTLQDLPDDYIKITGRSSQSYYTIDFNFAYFFNEPGANIDDYPPIFKRYLREIEGFVGVNDKGHLGIINEELASKFKNARFGYENSRFKGRSFYYWVNIPGDVCQVFSADESSPLQAPNFLGLFLMGSDLQAYNILQQQLTSIPLYSMVIGELPIDEKDKNEPLVLNTDAVDYFSNMINSLMPNGSVFLMSPTKNNRAITFNEQPNATKVYTSALQDMIATAGMAGLLSTTDKPNLSQNKASQKTEKRFVDILYEQFKDFVNRRLDRMTEEGYLRYDWKFDIFGDIFSDDEEFEVLGRALTAGETYYLPRRLAMKNLTLQDATILAHQVKASGIYDLLEPLVSAYQQSGKGKKDPFDTETKKSIPDSKVENEHTARSKEAGTNLIEGRH